jgi:hypothetical protein
MIFAATQQINLNGNWNLSFHPLKKYPTDFYGEAGPGIQSRLDHQKLIWHAANFFVY